MRSFYPQGGWWHEEATRGGRRVEQQDPDTWGAREDRDRWDLDPSGIRPVTIRRPAAETRRPWGRPAYTAVPEPGAAWSGPSADLPRPDVRRRSPTFDPDRAGYRSPLESAGELHGWSPTERHGGRAEPSVAEAPRAVSRPPARYTRPDERIRDDVYDRLMGETGIDASDVDVIVKNGEVTLSGTVRDRVDKRRIEELAEGVLGVRDVHNQLRRSLEGVHAPDRTRLPS
jgi:hypothetical protein